MADVAKKDFPNLTDNDIDVVVFGGQHKKRHYRSALPRT